MKKKSVVRFLTTTIVCLTLAAVLVACGKTGTAKSPETGATSSASPASGDIVISKSEITDQAKFIPYEVGNVKMEIIAVKAPDDTIRTAFNTCQVCYDSGRGYYEQVGDRLVCQNCGNQFKISQIEKQKNGCNPVPILEGDKKDDGKTITISSSFLEQNKELFSNWKTN